MTDLERMGAELSAPQNEGEQMLLEGSAPAAELSGYQSELTAYTRGRGRLFCFPEGYRPCRDPVAVMNAIGYDCDADTENPADSIFCSHGAGHVVKWNEVERYLHTVIEAEKEREEASAPVKNEFKERAATDKELMAIFERTYGKIQRDERSAMQRGAMRRETKEPKPYRAAPLPDGPEYLLVDGYNIIFAWEKLADAAKESLDLARSELIRILCNYRGFRRCELIVVFDAYKVRGNRGEVEEVGGITVVYTKEAETADMYIEKATRTLGKKHRVRVATSDRLEQLIILGAGAVRMSAGELLAEVEQTEREIRGFLSEES